MPYNPFSILLVAEEVNSEGSPLHRENQLAKHYLKTWEKFFISRKSSYQSLNRHASASIQKQINESGAYLFDFVSNAGAAKDLIFDLDKQIKSEVCSLCDVSEFADGDFNERTANILSFITARTLVYLRDCSDNENLATVIPASLFALSRFGEWLHESQ